MSSRRLILVDGNALLYRSFFAIPGLATSSGIPTNALFGFVKTLRRVRQDLNPTHWMVVFDGGIAEERRKKLESYKANRPKRPDDLKLQFESTQQYLDCAGVTWLRQDGCEADDILASATARAEETGTRVFIVTNDKDFYQLVNEQVTIVSPSNARKEMNNAAVRAKTGVGPENIVAWLSMVGDSSDNIPGVPGVGAKTAARLLEEHGSLEKLWQALDSVTPTRIRDALASSMDVVERNVELISLDRNMIEDLDWEELRVRPEDPDKMLPFLEKMELHSIAEDFRETGLL